MEKLNTLKMFHKDVEIVDINTIDRTRIPESWKQLFEDNIFENQKGKLVHLWRITVGVEMSNSIDFIEENLCSLDLIFYNNVFSILYGIKCEDGEVYYFEGGNPKDAIGHKLLDGMPDKLKEFYLDLHNGFFFYPSRMMGLVPLDEVTHFSDDEWGIIEELEEPIKISLESTYGFFKNGGGGYLAVDYNNCNDNKATLWFDDMEPEYDIDFWNFADEWLRIGFE